MRSIWTDENGYMKVQYGFTAAMIAIFFMVALTFIGTRMTVRDSGPQMVLNPVRR